MAAPATLSKKAPSTALPEASPSSTPPKAGAVSPKKSSQLFKRADLVGKFPHIKHLPAPKAVRRLDHTERELILAAMLLG